MILADTDPTALYTALIMAGATATIAIIGALAAGIVKIITALGALKSSADQAVSQNEQLLKQTDGNHTALIKLLDSLIAALADKPVPSPAVIVTAPAPATVAEPRQVRKGDTLTP